MISTIALMLGLGVLGVPGENDPGDKPNPKLRVKPSSDDGVKKIQQFQIPEGITVKLWAAEPQLANPVALWVDHQGKVFVAETFRLHQGVTDNRHHMNWLVDDLACRTVSDRDAKYKKFLGKGYADYKKFPDQIRLLVDSNNDGKADRSKVFATGFQTAVTGIGSGVISRGNEVWYTCIPDLVKLKDADGDGRSDSQEVLHTGYGVRTSFLGHDSHGLRFGPDGYLYFSIGDRGVNITTKEGKKIEMVDTGAVFRCNPDGSDLEVFCSGLRNPQELIFDEFGNLFTGDNNSDSGDKARWVHLVEGTDSGWRIGYQYLKSPTSRGPWNAEKLWHTAFKGQAAYVVPPVAYLGDGPSGLTYHPGVAALPDAYKKHFFLCDFRGGPGRSGIRSFANKPKGASFELVDSKKFLWNVLVTDADFGPDGQLYLSDWVNGWRLTGSGRIYRLFDEKKLGDPQLVEVKKWLNQGFKKAGIKELNELLGHADMRLRQEAQFELVDRGEEGEKILLAAAKGHGQRLARLHGIWGLGMIARLKSKPDAIKPALALLNDADAEIRAQAIKILGDAKYEKARPMIINFLNDPNPRIKLYAALALNKIGNNDSVKPLLELLKANADQDRMIRHAAIMGLLGSATADELAKYMNDPSVSVRLAVAVALRRLESPHLGKLVADKDPLVAAEAARAIYDVPVKGALTELANPSLDIDQSLAASPAFARRVLNAHWRVGDKKNAQVVSAIAANSKVNQAVRVEALNRLADWGKAESLDPVTGLYDPRPAKSPEVARNALSQLVADLLKTGPMPVRLAAAKACGKLKIDAAGDALAQLVLSGKGSAKLRIEALSSLGKVKNSQLAKAVNKALDDKDPALRAEAQSLLATLEPAQAMQVLDKVLETGTVLEKQRALSTLAGFKNDVADGRLEKALQQMLDKKLPIALQLDLLEAAAKRNTPGIKQKLQAIAQSRASDDPMQLYAETLEGGNAEKGKDIFLNKTAVSCVRCHRIGTKGGEVGPKLDSVGVEKKRDYILESLVNPNAKIAKGFETTLLATVDGEVITGIVREETDDSIKLITPKAKFVTVAKDDIEQRSKGKSAMPDDLMKHLSKRELRDLVEYLAQQKKPVPKESK